ncbi:MAG: uL22 family ribosomal protein [Candidatus Pacearchaeota archaeon]
MAKKTEKEIAKKEEIKKPKTEVSPKPKESNEKKSKESSKNKEEKVKANSSNDSKKDDKEKPSKKIEKNEKNKKDFAIVNSNNLPISTKHSKAICKFIRGKKIGDAIADLEKVLVLKKAVPMKGEIGHRKGKGMMSGRFPKKASERFIKLLKSLSANSINHGIENPFVTEAIANIGSRPYGRFGRVRMKRTHVKLVAKNMENTKK